MQLQMRGVEFMATEGYAIWTNSLRYVQVSQLVKRWTGRKGASCTKHASTCGLSWAFIGQKRQHQTRYRGRDKPLSEPRVQLSPVQQLLL